jgi:hypothetical protein
MSEAMVKREVFDTIGGFRPHLVQSEDNDFWIRASKSFSVFHIDRCITRIRMHGINTSWDQTNILTWELQMKLSHNDGSFYMRRVLAAVCHKLAYEYRIRGEKQLFRKYTLKSMKYNPFYWKNYVYWLYSVWFETLRKILKH